MTQSATSRGDIGARELAQEKRADQEVIPVRISNLGMRLGEGTREGGVVKIMILSVLQGIVHHRIRNTHLVLGLGGQVTI